MSESNVIYELIETQIAQVADLMEDCRLRFSLTLVEQKQASINERLLQIVQNQQQLIEGLHERIAGAEVDICDLIEPKPIKGRKKK